MPNELLQARTALADEIKLREQYQEKVRALRDNVRDLENEIINLRAKLKIYEEGKP